MVRLLVRAVSLTAMCRLFQFQNGAIAGENNDAGLEGFFLSFNSKMVRLLAKKIGGNYPEIDLFQFQNGAIAGGVQGRARRVAHRQFQFQNGAIAGSRTP